MVNYRLKLFLGQFVNLHIGERIHVQIKIGTSGLHTFQKVDPAFAGRTFKPGKLLVTDIGAVAIFAFVSGASVVHIDIGRDLKTGGKDFIFFLVKTVLAFNQQIVQIPRRYINSHLMQLFQQERLGDMAVVILIKAKPDQSWTKVLAV